MNEISKIAEELQREGQYEGTEIGEWWIALGNLVPRVFDCASEDFLRAFEKELRAQYENFKEYIEEESYHKKDIMQLPLLNIKSGDIIEINGIKIGVALSKQDDDGFILISTDKL